jgi:hypothetical protein
MESDVKTFLDACEQKPGAENVHLYRGLIAEEYDEFCHAVVMRDEVEQLDACMDMIWVILGYCHMKGYDIKGAWEEVANSNLSKIDYKTGKVIRREDGKILKPEGWTPPNLTRFI